MALVLTEEQTLLKDSASGFFAERSPISSLRDLRDSYDSQGYKSDLWQEMAEMGFTSLLLSEDEGGTGFGFVGAGIVAEEMAKTLAPSPFIASSIVATSLLKATKNAHLSDVASGQKIATLAVDETGHHSPYTPKTTSDSDGKVSGNKTFVPEGKAADFVIVTADRPGGFALYLVEKDATGFSAEQTIMADSRGWAKLSFDNTPATLLASGDAAKAILANALSKANIILSAELLGLSQAAFDMTVNYLKERKQFGQIIGTFQSLQHRAAHMFSEIETTRSIVLAALQAADSKDVDDQRLAIMASAAKARASKMAELVSNEAIQMHGGIGMTDEYDIGFFIKRARAVQNLYGGYHYHLDRFASLNGY